MTDLSGKTALVTGSTSGIGKATAIALAARGAHVFMRFPDHQTAVNWYNSPAYQQLINVRSVAMDARFSLLDGLAS